MKPFYIDFVVDKKLDPAYIKKREADELMKRTRKCEKKASKREEQGCCAKCCDH
jgi:hypothetical protein